MNSTRDMYILATEACQKSGKEADHKIIFLLGAVCITGLLEMKLTKAELIDWVTSGITEYPIDKILEAEKIEKAN